MSRAEIGARLDHLLLASPGPERCAASVASMLGARPEAIGECIACGSISGPDDPGARVLFTRGRENRLVAAAFAFDDRARFEAFSARLAAEGVRMQPNCSPLFGAEAFCVSDPCDTLVAFGCREQDGPKDRGHEPLRLQHYGVRTDQVARMREFYEKTLHFVLTDTVEDAEGIRRAVFLRTDAEHHTLALFMASEQRLDHLSFDTPDVQSIRDWADRVTAKKIPMFWGLGRHGPGNDLFFMVKDVDGNLVEFSTELEVCGAERPAVKWDYNNWTMNLWGQAFMRS